MSLPEELTAGLDVTQVTPVHGGDIARAYRLDTSDGPVFLKTHPSPTHLLFEREARGLRALREAAPTGLRVPEVLASSPSGLVLEWIDEGRRSSGTEAALGAITARTLVVDVDSDRLFLPGQAEQLARCIPDARRRTVASLHGHDGFLIEADQMEAVLRLSLIHI